MPWSRLVPLSVVLLLLLWAAPALAQPVSFQLKNDVPAGQKPSLQLLAMESVRNVEVSLARDDGEKFVQKLPALDAGKSAVVPIGDGKAGKAHYTGKIALEVVGAAPWSYELAFDTLVRAGVTISYDYDHLDLAGHSLRFQLSRPAGKADVVVTGEDGSEVGRGSATYKGEPPGKWLPITWQKTGDARVMTIRLHAVAADGLSSTVELIPWSVAIEHEDVNFDSNSSVIKPDEAKKLDASLVKIDEAVKRADKFVKVKLYVAGHTDTVGSKEHNQKLSQDRARAIAEYFRQKGLAIPIVYAGFGEEVPKVQTPDSTDEPRNRRADYVLGAAAAAPPFSGAYHPREWSAVK